MAGKIARKKNSPRQFDGMGYRQIQRSNSDRRRKLPPGDRTLLRKNGYKNVGWDQVIRLHLKINELLAIPEDEDSLEDLFLQAERIGNKYQTSEEVEAFQTQLTQKTQDIATLVDQQFPVSSEIEYIDFSQSRAASNSKSVRKIPRRDQHK